MKQIFHINNRSIGCSSMLPAGVSIPNDRVEKECNLKYNTTGDNDDQDRTIRDNKKW
jgi:hypothetical protein